MEFFKKLFDNDFMPHGHCYFWDPAIVWINSISGSLIALAYLTIPFTLLYIVRKRKDINFKSLVVLFALFILSCSATHIMDVINIWYPMYRLDSAFRVITALASIGTAVMLVKITPQILSIPHSDLHKKLNEELKEQIIRLKEKDRTIELLKENRDMQDAMTESEGKFKTIFDNSLAAIVVTDDEGNYLSANKAASDLFHYPVNELLQMNVRDLRTSSKDGTAKRFEDYISKGEEIGEFDFTAKNGTHKFIQFQAIRTKVDFNLSILMDVTDQKIAESKLKANEKRLQFERKTLHDFFTQAPAAFAILKGPEHVFEFANPAYLELTGNRDIKNKKLREALPEIAGQGFKELLDRVYQTGETFTGKEISAMLDRGNGKLESIFMNFTYQAFANDEGETEGILVFAYDVSDQVNARKQIEKSETAMRQISSYLKLATDSANVGTWSLNMQTLKVEWSALHNKMWGYDEHRTEITYEDWRKHILPEDVEMAIKTVEDARINHTDYNVEYRIRRANDHTVHYIRSVGKYYYNDKGEAETLTGISIEITEQKEAELKLKASEEKYRGIFETMDQAFSIIEVIFDSDNKPVDCVYIETNPVFEKQTGLINVVGKTVKELIPNIEEKWFQIYGKVALTGEPIHFIEVSEALGRWFETQSFRLGDQGSNKVAVLFTDITERKQVEEEIKASEKQFRIFANSIQNLAWIANEDGSIYWYNKQWYDYTGTTLEEMEGFGWQKVHHPEKIKNIIELTTELWKKPEPFELTFPLRRHDGEYRWFLTRVYPVLDANKNIERWIGTNTDIHQQKTIEQQKDEFISIASHEMKTPLTTAKGYIELLQLSLSEQNQTALYATKANQALERLHDLITELIDVSKIQNGQLDYTITEFDFNEMVDETIENFQHGAKNHSIQKRGNFSQQITGDRARLQQVLINLLSNAVKYSPKADTVLVNIKEQESNIGVSVQDFGVGISKQHLDKIFDRYYRVQEHAVHFQGLGIGLFISNNIIKRHEGTMWVESEPDKGSTFYFTLPFKSLKETFSL